MLYEYEEVLNLGCVPRTRMVWTCRGHLVPEAAMPACDKSSKTVMLNHVRLVSNFTKALRSPGMTLHCTLHQRHVRYGFPSPSCHHSTIRTPNSAATCSTCPPTNLDTETRYNTSNSDTDTHTSNSIQYQSTLQPKSQCHPSPGSTATAMVARWTLQRPHS